MSLLDRISNALSEWYYESFPSPPKPKDIPEEELRNFGREADECTNKGDYKCAQEKLDLLRLGRRLQMDAF